MEAAILVLVSRFWFFTILVFFFTNGCFQGQFGQLGSPLASMMEYW